MSDLKILSEKREVLSPWVSLISRTVSEGDERVQETYHSLEIQDYVAILAVTTDKKIPLVRQYRPAVKRKTLELPAGLLDEGLSPEMMAIRELKEETGFEVQGSVQFLGKLAPDVGRLTNSVWCYFAGVVKPTSDKDWGPERGVERVLLSFEEMRRAMENNEFDHAMHLGLIFLAVLKGCLKI